MGKKKGPRARRKNGAKVSQTAARQSRGGHQSTVWPPARRADLSQVYRSVCTLHDVAAAMHVVAATSADQKDWAALRRALWPDADDGDMARMLGEPARFAAFIARGANGRTIGFAEASLRHDYVNGCDTSPVGFLEGICCAALPPARRGRIACPRSRALGARARRKRACVRCAPRQCR